jgi:hypothetical protein
MQDWKPKVSKLPPDTRVVRTCSDGTVILECLRHTPPRDYAGLRECPKCQGERLKAEDRRPTGDAA